MKSLWLFHKVSCIPRLLGLPLVVFALSSQPAAAQWPTTEWKILDGVPAQIEHKFAGVTYWSKETGGEAPSGIRKKFAAKHGGMLESASRWYESMGFSAPYIKTLDGDLTVAENEPYVGYLEPQKEGDISSTTSANGTMELNTNPGFLSVGTAMWALMEASAVHELFHGIQNANASYRNFLAHNGDTIPVMSGCRDGNAIDWLVEGAAAAVQIRWLERTKGPWGHPFKGSSHATWKRYFDQPLHFGSLPPEILNGSAAEKRGWWCTYGTWYFWYAVGEFLGQTPAQKVSYLRYIIERDGPWESDGLAVVDAGLRVAARAFGAIEPYSQGLYDLYPQFVAQYLDADQFYEHLRIVDLGSPGLFEAKSANRSGLRGLLEPLAARAWRFRIHIPKQSSTHLIPVRFTLEAQPGTERRNLHLIVKRRVVGRPALETTPYSYIDSVTPTLGAVHEYLVRVANVAPEAEKTQPAAFELRVEVGGFYGKAPDNVDLDDVAAKVSAELPPGFYVRGPERFACSGGAEARAIFDLVTPDELGRDVERVIPESVQKTQDILDRLAIAMQRSKRELGSRGIDIDTGEARKALSQARKDTGPGAEGGLAQLAEELRARKVTTLRATLVGEHNGEECQLTLNATLAGREGGAQILHWAVKGLNRGDEPVPHFRANVYNQDALELLQSLPASHDQPQAGHWEYCTMTAEERGKAKARATRARCPAVVCTAGRLTLEAATQDRIAGSFEVEVVHWPPHQGRRCRLPDRRGTVVGHFNVTSTDKGYGDNSLFPIHGAARPGAPILDVDIGATEMEKMGQVLEQFW